MFSCPKSKANCLIKLKIFILVNLFHPLQSNPHSIQCTYANAFPNPAQNSPKKSSFGIAFKARSDSRWISSMDSKRCPRSGPFWVLGIARSYTVLNQANTVAMERYESNFWRNVPEYPMQCETAHYHDAKTKSCLPIILAFFCELH